MSTDRSRSLPTRRTRSGGPAALAALCLLVGAAPASPRLAAQEPAADEDRAAVLERAVGDAWLRGADDELPALEQRLDDLVRAEPEAARAHYARGLAGFLAVTRTNGTPDSSDRERALAELDVAEEYLERAVALDAGLADACAARALCVMHRFALNAAGPEQFQVFGQWVEKGRQADPERASVRLLETWLETSAAAATPDGLRRMADAFAALAEEVRGLLALQDRQPGFWDLFTQGMAARALVFAPEPRPGRAAPIVAAMLAQRPDCVMASAFLLPFIEVREPLAPEAWGALEWSERAVEAGSDGLLPGLADAASLATCLDEEALWLRIGLVAPPNPDVFGLNVVLDADGSQQTGSPWWGGGSSFVFDRLVSVWLARDEDGSYRGALGVTDDRGALEGEMANLENGTVGFAVDVEGRAFVLRVPRAALAAGEGAAPRFLVAVGSNAQWNDNLPDQGGLAPER